LTRLPTLQNWLETLYAAGLFALAACLIHVFIAPIQFSMSLPGLRLNPPAFLSLAGIALLIPALSEELIFRAIAQPQRLSSPQQWAFSTLSLGLFVLWHPVQIWIGLPTGQSLFLTPAFLVLVAILGVLCSLLTHRTQSLWPAVSLHWVIVVIWKAGSA